MPISIEENIDPRTTGTYEPDRVPQGFEAPDRFGRMRPNRYAGARIGGGYDAPQGTPTWTPTWDQTSGITNRNLGGYKVMNALSIDPSADDFFLRELWNYGKRYLPSYDPENDEYRQKKYRDSLEENNPVYDPNNPKHYMLPPQDDTFEDKFPPYDPNNPKHFMAPEGLPEDFPFEDIINAPRMEANLSQTWKKILEKTGSEDLANEWLATQQANRGGLMSLV